MSAAASRRDKGERVEEVWEEEERARLVERSKSAVFEVGSCSEDHGDVLLSRQQTVSTNRPQRQGFAQWGGGENNKGGYRSAKPVLLNKHHASLQIIY